MRSRPGITGVGLVAQPGDAAARRDGGRRAGSPRWSWSTAMRCSIIGLLCAAALAVTLLAYGYMDARGGWRDELYVLILIATLGAAVLAAERRTSLSLFLGLELLSVSLFVLVAYPIAERTAARSGDQVPGAVRDVVGAAACSGSRSSISTTGALAFAALGRAGAASAARRRCWRRAHAALSRDSVSSSRSFRSICGRPTSTKARRRRCAAFSPPCPRSPSRWRCCAF